MISEEDISFSMHWSWHTKHVTPSWQSTQALYLGDRMAWLALLSLLSSSLTRVAVPLSSDWEMHF